MEKVVRFCKNAVLDIIIQKHDLRAMRIFFALLLIAFNTGMASGKDVIKGTYGLDEENLPYRLEISRYEKENKEFLKTLKKCNNLGSLKVICLAPGDFVIKTCVRINKKTSYGLINDKGQTILPMEYDEIKIYPGFQSGLYTLTNNSNYSPYSYQIPVGSQQTRYVGKKDRMLYLIDEHGNTLFSTEAKNYIGLPGLFFFSNTYIDLWAYQFGFEYKGLFNLIDRDGNVKMENVCFLSWYHKDNPSHFKLQKTYEDGYKGYGYFSLAENKVIVPAVFCKLYEYKDSLGWNFSGTQKAYDSSKSTRIKTDSVYTRPVYDDEGEKLLELERFSEAINYYNTMESQNALSPKGLLRRGVAKKYIVRRDFQNMPDFEVFIKNGTGSNNQNEKWNSVYQSLGEKLENSYYEDLINSANKDAEAYLALDVEYQEYAMLLLNTRIYETIDDVEKVRKKYNAAVASIQQYNYYNSTEYYTKQAVRQSLTNVANYYADKAINSLSGNSRSSSQNNVTQNQKSSGTNGGASETEESGRGGNVEAQIRKVEKYIEEEKERLEKAQKRYAENPTGAAKSAIDAHKRAIQGYYKQLSDLKK